MTPRSSATLLVLLLGGCDVDTTVGYNDGEGALVGGARCTAEAPLGRCAGSPCVVTDLFDPPLGAITIAVDAENAFFLSGPQALARRPLAGGPSVDLASADSTLMRMTIDDRYVYWTELNGKARGVPKAGGASFDAGYVFGNPTDIAVDSEYLYWVLPGFGEVAMAPKPSGEATHIGGQGEPRAIAVDATHVYWVNATELVRALRGNLASAEVILSDLDDPVAISVSDDAVYWASKNAVFRLPKDGAGEAAQIAGGFDEVKAIAVFGNTVYGAGMDGLWRVPVSGDDPFLLDRRPMSALTLTCSGVYASGWFDSVFVRYAPQ